jgi:hypothetical protein
MRLPVNPSTLAGGAGRVLVPLHPKQVESVLKLPAPERFEHFVKVVADTEQAWGLYEDGWALAGADDGAIVFPLWPAQDYAALCATGEWRNYLPKQISVHDVLSELLPKLELEKVMPGVFYTPEDRGVTVSAAELRKALEAELSRY